MYIYNTSKHKHIYIHINISQAPQTLTVQYRSVNATIRLIQKLGKTNSEKTE